MVSIYVAKVCTDSGTELWCSRSGYTDMKRKRSPNSVVYEAIPMYASTALVASSLHNGGASPPRSTNLRTGEASPFRVDCVPKHAEIRILSDAAAYSRVLVSERICINIWSPRHAKNTC
eukprot:COSAG01_NODE_13593_length_1562_cov_1.968558_1_plen_118_part_10